MMDYLSFISGLFLPLLQILIMHKCMTAVLGSANRKWLGYVGWLVYYLYLVAAGMGIIFSSKLLLMGNILLVFAVCTITRSKSAKRRCVFALLICTVWMLVEVIVLLLLGAIGMEQAVIANAGSFISKMCMLFFSVVISHSIKETYHSEISLRYFLVILLIPAGSIYMMHHVFRIAAAHEEYALFSTIMGMLLLFANYMIFEVYDRMSRDAELQAQNRLYEQQLELCSHQAEERERLYIEVRRMRHDMKNHLFGLLGMARAGETKDAESYILGMLDGGIGDCAGEVSRSGNTVVDSLVNYKYALAQKDGIRFEANVLIPSSLPFQSGHLAIIVGNLLENAMEACRNVPQEQRYISIEISYVKEMLQFCIRNSCLPAHRIDGAGRYLTTKKDTVHHGIGLSSVEQVAAFYHGAVDVRDHGSEFQATVVLCSPDGGK